VQKPARTAEEGDRNHILTGSWSFSYKHDIGWNRAAPQDDPLTRLAQGAALARAPRFQPLVVEDSWLWKGH